jgi:hypothetical protein
MQVVLAAGRDAAAVARNAERARQELAFFNQGLRAIVGEAERALGADGADLAGRPQLPRLRAAILSARSKAVPAALAAGASAAFAGMAAGPAAMGTAVPSGSIAALAAAATEAAATAMLAEHSPPGVTTSLVQLAHTDLDALDDCAELLRSAAPAALERASFMLRRGVFQTMQDCAGCSFGVRDFLLEWSRAFMRRLDSGELSAEDAHVLVNGARLALAKQPA